MRETFRLGRLYIIRSGYPPYLPNWKLRPLMIAGWHPGIESRLERSERLAVEALWANRGRGEL